MTPIYETLKNELKTFIHTNNFTDVILGLSGGMDSAFVAVLAADALGSDHVHTLMMKTQFTSPESITIARTLTQINKINYQELDIQPLVNQQTIFLQESFKEKPNSIVLENIQARLRGQILMAYANQYHYLVLACANASEIAMGYCTLYGDTCGGLSPIGNIYKTDLYQLAAQRQLHHPVYPAAVLTRAPSAELAAGQKDEDSLPPYPILDKILKAFLIEKKSLEEIIKSGINKQLAVQVVNRYYQMAFKRKQMPPILNISFQ